MFEDELNPFTDLKRLVGRKEKASEMTNSWGYSGDDRGFEKLQKGDWKISSGFNVCAFRAASDVVSQGLKSGTEIDEASRRIDSGTGAFSRHLDQLHPTGPRLHGVLMMCDFLVYAILTF